MPREAHTKAAEHHENAAKSHRTAAEHHGKGDHDKGREESTRAQGHSNTAREHSEAAHGKGPEPEIIKLMLDRSLAVAGRAAFIVVFGFVMRWEDEL